MFRLLVTTAELSEYLKQQPTLSPSNLFRKVRLILMLQLSTASRTVLRMLTAHSSLGHMCLYLLPVPQQYGNLDHVFNYEQMRDLFLLDGAVIRLQPQPLLERARDGGLISDELLAKCIAMHRFKRVHDLTTMKNTGQNECAVCRRPYPMLANNSRACDNGENHRPAFDWDKAEDVLQCEIRQ